MNYFYQCQGWIVNVPSSKHAIEYDFFVQHAIEQWNGCISNIALQDTPTTSTILLHGWLSCLLIIYNSLKTHDKGGPIRGLLTCFLGYTIQKGAIFYWVTVIWRSCPRPLYVWTTGGMWYLCEIGTWTGWSAGNLLFDWYMKERPFNTNPYSSIASWSTPQEQWVFRDRSGREGDENRLKVKPY